MKINLKNIFRGDWTLLAAVFLLLIVGLLSIYSTSLNNIETKMVFFNKQLIFALSGILLMLIVSLSDYRILKSYYKIFVILTYILLLIVLFTGRTIRGASAWIELFGFQFQPVELAKIALIIFLATYLSSKAREFYHSWKPIFISTAVILPMIILVAAQPDMGSALILFAIWIIMIFFTKIDKNKIIVILLIIAITLASGWFLFLKDYQKNRILTFLDPEKDPLGVGYNLSQSITAVGSGKLTGRGFGLGSQSQLNFLPEQRTDFIFAVISEEFGFIGSLLTMILIIIILLRIIMITQKTSDNFAIYLALGFFILFFVQSAMNIAMNVGLAPVIGVPLPFVSYGGTSLWVSLLSIGILESILIHRTN
ncbi:rod shape-determining protein RodA [bacterium]|nr:rod shape-determining protein RodA [bacterium]